MEEGSIMEINRKLLTVNSLRELLMIGDGSGMIKAWQRDGKERPWRALRECRGGEIRENY